MTDIIGVIRLVLFILTHPVGTYRFIKDILVLFRVLHLDVFGRVLPLFQKPARAPSSPVYELKWCGNSGDRERDPGVDGNKPRELHRHVRARIR
jgi:hypothetical protein